MTSGINEAANANQCVPKISLKDKRVSFVYNFWEARWVIQDKRGVCAGVGTQLSELLLPSVETSTV